MFKNYIPESSSSRDKELLLIRRKKNKGRKTAENPSKGIESRNLVSYLLINHDCVFLRKRVENTIVSNNRHRRLIALLFYSQRRLV